MLLCFKVYLLEKYSSVSLLCYLEFFLKKEKKEWKYIHYYISPKPMELVLKLNSMGLSKLFLPLWTIKHWKNQFTRKSFFNRIKPLFYRTGPKDSVKLGWTKYNEKLTSNLKLGFLFIMKKHYFNSTTTVTSTNSANNMLSTVYF